MQRIKTFIHDHPHIWWGLFLPVYLGIFFTIEHFITDNYFRATQPAHRLRDFSGIPWSALPPSTPAGAYCCLFLGESHRISVKDGEGFRRYMWSIMITFLFSTLICALIPNGQDLRPAVMPRDNIFCDLVAYTYSLDTNTNVFPGVHVVGVDRRIGSPYGTPES